MYRQQYPACWSGSVHGSCPWLLGEDPPWTLCLEKQRTSHLGGHCFLLGRRKIASSMAVTPSLRFMDQRWEFSTRTVYQCVCGLARQLTRKQQAEAGAGADSWALHGRGWRKQMRMWKSFGRSGWSSSRGSAGSELVLHWVLPFCAVSLHPLMQKMCLRVRENVKEIIIQ